MFVLFKNIQRALPDQTKENIHSSSVVHHTAEKPCKQRSALLLPLKKDCIRYVRMLICLFNLLPHLSWHNVPPQGGLFNVKLFIVTSNTQQGLQLKQKGQKAYQNIIDLYISLLYYFYNVGSKNKKFYLCNSHLKCCLEHGNLQTFYLGS